MSADRHSAKYVALQIARLLGRGLLLSQRVRDVMASMIGTSDIETLQSLLQDESDALSLTLQELLFFPDQTLQENLEDILQEVLLSPTDEAALIATLQQQALMVPIVDDNHAVLWHMVLPPAMIPVLVKRLKVWRHLPGAIASTLQSHLTTSQARFCRVAFRNASFAWNDVLTEFFVTFFKNVKLCHLDFEAVVEVVLRIVNENATAADLQKVFARKRDALLRALHQHEIYEAQRLTLNMEILMAQRATAPALNSMDVRKHIVILDTICQQL